MILQRKCKYFKLEKYSTHKFAQNLYIYPSNKMNNQIKTRKTMARPVTLCTLQWGDLPLQTVCEKAKSFGFDGLELGLPAHVDVPRNRPCLLSRNQKHA